MASFRQPELTIASKRKSYSDYEEIVVDKVEKIELVAKENLVSIKDNFDELGQVAFKGCTHLNQVQSIVFETAYKTNKNLLVAAPTGSGKTNVAMMTVLSELKNWFHPGTKDKIADNISEKFKIIYIAPMKSLATEQAENFSSRLKNLGIKTRELTGDMSLTEREISQTHILVTTPEKWDVVTRKSKGDMDLLSLVRLLIIDEIHLLQSDRGPVLEALVARTLRYIESSQKMTRIVGLSATLPNYQDVAAFLQVDPSDGLFYFDNRFRPVPLTQTFIGVRPYETNAQSRVMDRICYNYIVQYALQSKQVMIFVHARNSTQRVATKLREMMQFDKKLELFAPDFALHPEAPKLINSSRNSLLRDLFAIGFGIHHAGMLRHDRLLVEKLFRSGVLKVLICTATLAWGVNFPAHAVIIRGTEIYDSAAGKFVDVGLLDVMQIFGRAGRPQYDTDGHAIILSSLEKMDSYLRLLTNQTPIESNFSRYLTDNLNAEVVSGTVSSIDEAMEWLKYTYLSIRLVENPLSYGYEPTYLKFDPCMINVRRDMLKEAARQLDEAQMCRYNADTGNLDSTYLGRIASHFYIKHETIMRYNEIMRDELEPPRILLLIAEAQEFQQIKFREEEWNELDHLRHICELPIEVDLESTLGKVSCLLQAYIGRAFVKSHSLNSDIMYISQNAARIGRGLFEYSLRRGWPMTTLNLLKICKMIELRSWDFQSPLRHFELPGQVIAQIEDNRCSIERLETMSNAEIGKLVRFPEKMGQTVKEFISQLPSVIVIGKVKPIKSNLITITLSIQPGFSWNDRYHGKSHQTFWLWVVDEEITKHIHYSECLRFRREQVIKQQPLNVRFNIPLVDETFEDGTMNPRLPNEFIVHVCSDDWVGCDYEFPVDCRKVILPNEPLAYTKVPSNLNPLGLTVLDNEILAQVLQPSEGSAVDSQHSSDPDSRVSGTSTCLNEGAPKFEFFNLMQSQIFHILYHSDKNVLLCGPSGSGKTRMADVGLLRLLAFKSKSKSKLVYITPVESQAVLKYRDWSDRIGYRLRKEVVLLDERNMSQRNVFEKAHILVATAHNFLRWFWLDELKDQVDKISVFIFDDLHLLSEKRGIAMEMLICELNHLRATNDRIKSSRFIGISNTISNAHDVANWLGIKKVGAYNFRQELRPIQLDIIVDGFSERHYNPRMASMNRPIFKSILTYSSADPVIIFVSSKKQCNLTAQDLISCLVRSQATQTNWLKISGKDIISILGQVKDSTLRSSLEFGIGLLYQSMKVSDKRLVSELFCHGKIQVLVCTMDYVWETDYRARLVIVKGTEHYDDESESFVDYSPSDVMQMLGRSGRPNIDATGISILMLRDIHKEYYKKFLYESFPIESRLLNAEESLMKNFLLDERVRPISDSSSLIASDNQGGSTQGLQDPSEKSRLGQKLLTKLSRTFLARRLFKNANYYGNEDGKSPQEFLSKYVDEFLDEASNLIRIF